MSEFTRRTYLKGALVAGGTVLAGCLGSDDDGADTPGDEGATTDDDSSDDETGGENDDGPSDDGTSGEDNDDGSGNDEDGADDSENTEDDGGLPDLLVVADGRTDGGNNYAGGELSRLSYSDDGGTYEVEATYTPEQSITSVAPFGDSYVVAERQGATSGEETTILVLDGEMTVQNSRTVDGKHAVATDDETIYSAHERGFISFDRPLQQLGEATLAQEVAGKHMEDVVIYDEEAYIVDNVIFPLYLFRVDVSDPATPSYTEVVEPLGINQSLHQQWLSPDEQRWQCLQTTTHMAGGEQNVVVASLDEPPEESFEGPDGEIAKRTDGQLSYHRMHEWRRQGHPTESEDVSVGTELEVDGSGRVDTVPGYAAALFETGALWVYETAADELAHSQELSIETPLDVIALA